MQRLTDNKLCVNLQILDNEDSEEYKRTIKNKWNAKYQLVTPHTHLSNAAERAIHTFKAHFLSILAGVAPDFPRNLSALSGATSSHTERHQQETHGTSAVQRVGTWEWHSNTTVVTLL